MADPAGATNYITITSDNTKLAASMPDVGNTFAGDLVLNSSTTGWSDSAGDFINGLGVETIVEGGVSRVRPTNLRMGNPDFSVESAWGCKRITQGASPELIIGFAVKSTYPLSHTATTPFTLWRGCDLAGAPSVTSWENRAGVVPVADGFVGYWPLEEAAGTFYDWTANANDGTDNVAATGKTGKVGAGQQFVPNDQILFSNQAAIQRTSATMSVWVNAPSPGVSYRGLLVKQLQAGLFLVDGVASAYLWGSGLQSSGVNCADGAWHLVTLSFDSGVANGSVLYVDGVPGASFTGTIGGNTLAPVLGGGGPGFTGQELTGYLDEAWVSAIRSANWITSYYNMTSANGTFWTVGPEQPVGGLVLPRRFNAGFNAGFNRRVN